MKLVVVEGCIGCGGRMYWLWWKVVLAVVEGCIGCGRRLYWLW